MTARRASMAVLAAALSLHHPQVHWTAGKSFHQETKERASSEPTKKREKVKAARKQRKARHD